MARYVQRARSTPSRRAQAVAPWCTAGAGRTLTAGRPRCRARVRHGRGRRREHPLAAKPSRGSRAVACRARPARRPHDSARRSRSRTRSSADGARRAPCRRDQADAGAGPPGPAPSSVTGARREPTRGGHPRGIGTTPQEAAASGLTEALTTPQICHSDVPGKRIDVTGAAG